MTSSNGICRAHGEPALSSVGCYHLEGVGAQLFERVEGDYFAILGLPAVWPARVSARAGHGFVMTSDHRNATVVAGVAGRPVRHSLSPILHNAWLAAAGIDGVYVTLSPTPEGFSSLVEGLRGGAIRGLNTYHSLQGGCSKPPRTKRPNAPAAPAPPMSWSSRRMGRIRADNTDGEGLHRALASQGARARSNPLRRSRCWAPAARRAAPWRPCWRRARRRCGSSTAPVARAAGDRRPPRRTDHGVGLGRTSPRPTPAPASSSMRPRWVWKAAIRRSRRWWGCRRARW